MTGPEHYREAEALLMGADEADRDRDEDPGRALRLIAEAQVRATLALAAATALAEGIKLGAITLAEYGGWAEAAAATGEEGGQ